jgi:hypothetical protein
VGTKMGTSSSRATLQDAPSRHGRAQDGTVAGRRSRASSPPVMAPERFSASRCR